MSVTIAIVGSDDRSRLALVTALEAAPADWMLELHREPPQDAEVVVCDQAVDAPGAVVFDGRSPDELIAQVAARVGSARIVAVTSPSGGTGATSVALHMAAEFAARGHRTAVADVDTHWGIRGRLYLETLPSASFPIPVAGGFRLIEWSPRSQPDSFDRIVLDVARASLSQIGAVRTALLICSPSPEGARRARTMLEEHPGLPWQITINRLGPGGETTRSEIARVLDQPVTELPCCAALRDAEDDGRLVARGWTRWSRALNRLVERLDAA